MGKKVVSVAGKARGELQQLLPLSTCFPFFATLQDCPES
jgi:hypothetical protein